MLSTGSVQVDEGMVKGEIAGTAGDEAQRMIQQAHGEVQGEARCTIRDMIVGVTEETTNSSDDFGHERSPRCNYARGCGCGGWCDHENVHVGFMS